MGFCEVSNFFFFLCFKLSEIDIAFSSWKNNSLYLHFRELLLVVLLEFDCLLLFNSSDHLSSLS